MMTNLCTLDWTAIGAIATAVMACFTLITIRQGKKQLAELKRPRLMPLLVSHRGRAAEGYLRIKNVSDIPAYEISVRIVSKDEATTKDPCVFYEDLVEALSKTTFALDPHGIKDFKLVDTIWEESMYSGKLEINIEYKGSHNEKKCSETFILSMSEYTILGESITNENAIAQKIEGLRQTIEDVKCLLR